MLPGVAVSLLPSPAPNRAPDLSRLLGQGRRTWARLRPTTRRPCRVTVRDIGDGGTISRVPTDLSLGGCGLRWTGAPPPTGTRCTVELQLPTTTLLVPGIVAHARLTDPSSGVFGVRFLTGAALESAMIPLGAYLLSLQDSVDLDQAGE